MKHAIEEAEKAYNKNEVPIGAVIVHNGKIISRQHNRNIELNDSTAHAEMLAIKDACKVLGLSRLDDCDIYVSLEPCYMCAYAISLAKIKRLYYALDDEKGGGVKIYHDYHLLHTPEIYSDIMADESRNLLQSFFQGKR